jgi:hypothetical protein
MSNEKQSPEFTNRNSINESEQDLKVNSRDDLKLQIYDLQERFKAIQNGEAGMFNPKFILSTESLPLSKQISSPIQILENESMKK